MWLKDTGILDKVKYDAMNPPNLIPDPVLRVDEPIILQQLGIIMILLVGGLSIGTLLFLTCGTQVLHVAIFELFFMVVFNLLTTSFRYTKLLPNAVAQWNYISK